MELTKIPLQGMSSEGAGIRIIAIGVTNNLKIDIRTDKNGYLNL
jgi:hypothetical protein